MASVPAASVAAVGTVEAEVDVEGESNELIISSTGSS